MSESNKALVRRLFDEVWNQGDLDAADALVAADVVNHDPQNPKAEDRDAFKRLVLMYHQAFPDLQFTIEDLLADGDKVVVRYRAEGTQAGPLPGIPATGRSGEVTGIAIHRIADGQVAEVWVNWDALKMLQNLGLFPEPRDL